MAWLLAHWRDYATRIATFRHLWREARCSHPGAREFVTYEYHETIGAWALECQVCGTYWDQTHGGSPAPVWWGAALCRAFPALRTPVPPPPPLLPTEPF
mgnify:CR=1 FL=1